MSDLISKIYQKFNSLFAGITVGVRKTFKKYPVVVVASMFVLLLVFTSFVVMQKNTVNVFEGDTMLSSFYSFNRDDADLLAEANIVLAPGDEYEVIWEDNNATLKISRAISVELQVDGGSIFVKTQPCTVADLLLQQQISLTETDTVTPNRDAVLSDGEKVVVTRIVKKSYTETVDIDFETVKKNTKTLFVGENKVKQAGVKGKKTITYEVVMVDGVVTDKRVISQEVTKDPESEIVLVGTKKKPQVASASDLKGISGAPTSYKAVYKMNATAYTYGEDGGNITATGIVPYHGVVAVDPSVIPLGSKLYIASADGSYVYGYAIAADTGGAIKGNRIDVFLESNSQVKKFGRKTMIVYVCK